jgi:hypothetical protein
MQCEALSGDAYFKVREPESNEAMRPYGRFLHAHVAHAAHTTHTAAAAHTATS